LSRRSAAGRAELLLGEFDLADVGGKLVKTYSGGMRRRLDLAVSLIGRPEVLFLDEPTTGLDPRSRNDVWRAVRGLVADGTTVLLTTQYLEEADRLADDVVVVDHGRVVERGTSDELKARLGGQSLQVRPADPARTDEVAAVLAALATAPPAPGPTVGSLAAPVADPDAVAELVRRLDAAGVRIAELALVRPTLDDVFLALTGGPAERATDSPDDADAYDEKRNVA
nr:DUF4162 domain-containing protein [Micromonospora sp. DSM 115978]